ncbi:MAG: Ger(x)C family spore germination protein [Oscillospiraceae bacterium]|jgi:spore germination protein KC|nr:Ger(x)C family spore germination protein [Oscillospiraceae bacterium]MCI1989834.1 Ger(x)C family spore germination protein [Oscillospiraceae bacterium]MCI2035524.1 Ger(x)C family spore germination protein [Oscillospiraceae bacterium]
MKPWKKIVLALETVLVLSLCVGCWNYHEVENYTIIAGLAIDKGTGGHKYHLTFECISLMGGKDTPPQPVLIEADGDTIFDAVRGTISMTDKKLYFSDCKVVILSKEIAENGIKPLMDFFIRDSEPRLTLNFLVSDEPTAGEVFRPKLASQQPVSYQIAGMLQSQYALGRVLAIPLYQMYDILGCSETCDESLTLPNVRVVKTKGSEMVQTSNNVVFHQDKMVGTLPEEDGIYYLMLRNKLSGGLIVTGPDGGKDITLEILKSSASIRPEVSGTNATMKIAIQVNAALAEENTDSLQYNLANEKFRKVEKMGAETIEQNVKKLVADDQKDYGADIFGFGKRIYEDNYSDWKALSPRWEKVFPKVKCEVHAEVRLKNAARAYPKEGT